MGRSGRAKTNDKLSARDVSSDQVNRRSVKSILEIQTSTRKYIPEIERPNTRGGRQGGAMECTIKQKRNLNLAEFIEKSKDMCMH